MKDLVRRGRSNSATGSAPSIRSVKPVPRMSILTSVKLPSLRRQDPTEPPPNPKPPLLSLDFTSRSFLDSQIHDSTSRELLYHFKTVGTSTIISRYDPNELFVKAASIKWPRTLPSKSGKDYTDGVLIQMKNARWYGGETLLKLGANANASRRFNIPNFSHPLKWKKYGNVYWCTTSSVKGPIATLDASRGPEPLKLKIYETFHDKYDTKPMPAFKGVSVLLLDYLLITAMLLVTDLQEWMLVRKADGQSVTTDTEPGPSFAPEVPFRSDPKFRKFMYGEPIFPKLSGEGSTKAPSVKSRSKSPVGSARRPSTPRTPDSGMPRFAYPESDGLSSPDASGSRERYASMTDSEDEEDDLDTFSLVETRSTSAIDNYHFSAAEPSHNYLDATFSSSEELPPVPPLPLQYAKSFRNFSSQPSTPISGTFAPSREPLLLPSADFISRPRSSPPLESSVVGSSRDSRQYSDSLEHPRVHSIARSESVMSQNSSMSRPSSSAARRPLPRPPPVPPINSSPPPARRVQSSSQLANYPAFPKDHPTSRTQRSLPPTPGIIASPTSTSSPTNLHAGTLDTVHSRLPPITKVSQEDLTNYVHTLTSPQRDLPPQPLPSTSIYDVPPPSYNSIAFDNPPLHAQQQQQQEQTQYRRPSLPSP
ncbi:hypothetical protein CPC08DRAFT_718829 [Agrocybe pediades]|nr:hypothetical protein CPC08DRAFT_718829 [Agrocybe pediades]